MPDHYLQESLQPLSSMLNHIVAEAIGKNLARQRWDCDPRRLSFQYVPKIFKVRVPASDSRVFELEGGDVRPADHLVVCVHAP